MMLLTLLLSLFVPSSDAAASATDNTNRAGHHFDPPPPGDWKTMTSAMCRGEAVPKLFPNAGDIFKTSNEGACKCDSPHDGGKKREDFFSPTIEECNINWALDSTDKPKDGKQCFPDGVTQTDNTKTDWGPNAGKVPAVLGFGGSITKLCGGDPDLKGNDSLEKCCMKKGKMFNRLWFNGDQPQHWTLCKNMKWLLCAAQGFLPGQKKGTKGGVIVLASAADTWGEQFRGKNDDTAEKVSVTVHETCLLDRICSNSADMWTTKKDAEFECTYDPPADLKKAGAASGTKSGVEGSISSKDDANKPPLKKVEKHTSMMEETKVAITETSPISAPYLAFGGVIALALSGAFALGRFWSRKEEEAYHLLAQEL